MRALTPIELHVMLLCESDARCCSFPDGGLTVFALRDRGLLRIEPGNALGFFEVYITDRGMSALRVHRAALAAGAVLA